MRKSHLLVLAIGLLIRSAGVAQAKGPLPSEVARFMEPGTAAIALEKGDVNGDGKPDYLLVVDHLRDARTEEEDDIRELLVLVRQKTGGLKLVARNSTILGCAVMQGAGGGIDVTTTGNGFDVADLTGSAAGGGTVRFKFEYKRREATWVLMEVDEESYGADESPAEHVRHVQKPYANGKVIRFAEFNGRDYSVDCDP